MSVAEIVTRARNGNAGRLTSADVDQSDGVVNAVDSVRLPRRTEL